MLKKMALATAMLGFNQQAAADLKYSYVNFSTSDGRFTVAGKLTLPDVLPAPAMIIVHGSAGPDARGPFYAESLNKNGIATLEIDMWAARKLTGGTDRPKHVGETVPDAYGAERFLSQRSDIVADKIGIMGFSWGGVVTMLTATKEYAPPEGLRPLAVHVAMYPVCWVYNKILGYGFRNLSGEPVLIQAGKIDEYDAPTSCSELLDNLPAQTKSLVSLKSYDNATHGFDDDKSFKFFDPYAFQGKGGSVSIVANREAALQARDHAVEFIREKMLSTNPASAR